MTTQTVNLRTLLEWSPAQLDALEFGGAEFLRRVASPNADFWRLWGYHKEQLVQAGVSCAYCPQDASWKVTWDQRPGQSETLVLEAPGRSAEALEAVLGDREPIAEGDYRYYEQKKI